MKTARIKGFRVIFIKTMQFEYVLRVFDCLPKLQILRCYNDTNGKFIFTKLYKKT